METVKIRGTEYEVCECRICGVVYTISAQVREQQRKSGGYSYCPNGHSWGWPKEESEDQRIRRERDLLKQQMARKDDEIAVERRRREQAERDASAARTATKRLQKRAAAGTCPCCKRTFSALSRHIQTKHPEFRAEQVIVPMKAAS